MIDLGKLDELAKKLTDLLPPAVRDGANEIEQNFKSALQAGFSRLDLVSREEFEVQRAVLLKTREKLDALESAVAALEAAKSAK